jgi:hypothetical protein
LQEDLFIARTRVTEVESQVTSLQHGNFILNSQLLDVADGGQQKAGSSLADATWLRDVKTQLEDMQVQASTLTLALVNVREVLDVNFRSFPSCQ